MLRARKGESRVVPRLSRENGSCVSPSSRFYSIPAGLHPQPLSRDEEKGAVLREVDWREGLAEQDVEMGEEE